MNPIHRHTLLLATLIAITLPALSQLAMAGDSSNWKQVVAERARLYGHRNWIVIADSAYPAQSREGIETIATNANQIDVVRQVLTILGGMKHVRPIVYTDFELKHVSDKDAPGISDYRKELSQVLGDRPVQMIPHEKIIAKLDEAGATFRVLILKTNLALPYTSVFLQLDCGYWNADSEKRLREAIGSKSSN
jgi:L-fucose mutarotase/ribose pyranase (RbsD/FucU family)